jgi:antitoxin component YwqK of YwqJK toxin-antitoxin module
MKSISIILFLLLVGLNGFGQPADTSYYDDGELKYLSYSEGEIWISKSYYTNSQLKNFSKTSFELGGFYSGEYCENGQLTRVWNPNSKDIIVDSIFNCDGNIEVIAHRNKYGYRGLLTLYHKNGQIFEQGNFEKTSSLFGDQKTGIWTAFSKEGKKIREILYKAGKEIDVKKF